MSQGHLGQKMSIDIQMEICKKHVLIVSGRLHAWKPTDVHRYAESLSLTPRLCLSCWHVDALMVSDPFNWYQRFQNWWNPNNEFFESHWIKPSFLQLLLFFHVFFRRFAMFDEALWQSLSDCSMVQVNGFQDFLPNITEPKCQLTPINHVEVVKPKCLGFIWIVCFHMISKHDVIFFGTRTWRCMLNVVAKKRSEFEFLLESWIIRYACLFKQQGCRQYDIQLAPSPR